VIRTKVPITVASLCEADDIEHRAFLPRPAEPVIVKRRRHI